MFRAISENPYSAPPSPKRTPHGTRPPNFHTGAPSFFFFFFFLGGGGSLLQKDEFQTEKIQKIVEQGGSMQSSCHPRCYKNRPGTYERFIRVTPSSKVINLRHLLRNYIGCLSLYQICLRETYFYGNIRFHFKIFLSTTRNIPPLKFGFQPQTSKYFFFFKRRPRR